MSAILEIYNTTVTVVSGTIVKIGDIQTDSTVDLGSVILKNIGSTAATLVRICGRCSNGLYTGQQKENGQEIVTGQYLEVDRNDGNGWTPIGGDFSPTDLATNYATLPDIAAGALSTQLDFRLNLTGITLESFGKVRFQGYLVSYQP